MYVTHQSRFLWDCQPSASLICFNDSALIDGQINRISSEISKEVRLESINCLAYEISRGERGFGICGAEPGTKRRCTQQTHPDMLQKSSLTCEYIVVGDLGSLDRLISSLAVWSAAPRRSPDCPIQFCSNAPAPLWLLRHGT